MRAPTSTCRCGRTHAHTQSPTRSPTHKQTQTRTHTHTHTHTHRHARTLTRTHTHTHTHARARPGTQATRLKQTHSHAQTHPHVRAQLRTPTGRSRVRAQRRRSAAADDVGEAFGPLNASTGVYLEHPMATSRGMLGRRGHLARACLALVRSFVPDKLADGSPQCEHITRSEHPNGSECSEYPGRSFVCRRTDSLFPRWGFVRSSVQSRFPFLSVSFFLFTSGTRRAIGCPSLEPRRRASRS